jgi:hypothetical protein
MCSVWCVGIVAHESRFDVGVASVSSIFHLLHARSLRVFISSPAAGWRPSGIRLHEDASFHSQIHHRFIHSNASLSWVA